MFSTEDWGSFYITFQKAEVRVVVYGRRDGDIGHWKKALPKVKVGTWGSADTSTEGLAFKLATKRDAERFLKAIGRNTNVLSTDGSARQGKGPVMSAP